MEQSTNTTFNASLHQFQKCLFACEQSIENGDSSSIQASYFRALRSHIECDTAKMLLTHRKTSFISDITTEVNNERWETLMESKATPCVLNTLENEQQQLQQYTNTDSNNDEVYRKHLSFETLLLKREPLCTLAAEIPSKAAIASATQALSSDMPPLTLAEIGTSTTTPTAAAQQSSLVSNRFGQLRDREANNSATALPTVHYESSGSRPRNFVTNTVTGNIRPMFGANQSRNNALVNRNRSALLNNINSGTNSDTLSDDDNESSPPTNTGDFLTAREKLQLDAMKKNQGRGGSSGSNNNAYTNTTSGASDPPKKSLGVKRKFVPPFRRDDDDQQQPQQDRKKKKPANGDDEDSSDLSHIFPDGLPDRLKNVEPKMIEMIMNEILDKSPVVRWDDIAGLEFAKKCVMEIVVWPLMRPDIFTGLRHPPKGLLLFGPPGTGKTLIGKAIASESGATFFNISASSLMSKWIGEGEKMVRALFGVATHFQPSVIFIDEVDSLLSQRGEGDFEASRRLKTEFLVQLDGAATSAEDRVLIIGATNRPQEIDEAARRRMVKRLYIPLPNDVARKQLVQNLMRKSPNVLSESDIADIVSRTDGYSGADMRALCTEAALGPIRSLRGNIADISADNVRPIDVRDFKMALKQVRASVSQKDLQLYVDWNKQFGSFDSEPPQPLDDDDEAAVSMEEADVFAV